MPGFAGGVKAPVSRLVEIERDKYGIPHIYASSDADLFIALGYAMAQDRLFQLDWLRRKGAGRLSEIVGNDGLEQDVLARTVGLNRIARAEWDKLPAETQSVLTAFSAGVNAVIEQSGDHLPIEFDLLDYRPEPWQPLDCLLIENEFRWYLTGRFPVIAIPELARRQLGDGPLYRAFLTAEADDESILSPGDYDANGKGVQPVGEAVGEPDSALGSNNWVVSGSRTASGKPHVASDPHIAFEAVSCWYEVHLQGGSFDVAGCTYVGMPAVLIGRNRRMTWGITNNISSQRDLYQEKTSPDEPDCFLNGDRWEPARELTELIHVRGFGPISKRIVFSHNGPIVSRDPAATGERNRSGFAQMAGGVSRRLVDRALGNESGRRRGIVSRGAAAVACADVFSRLCRHRGKYRLSDDGADSAAKTLGTRIPARLGSRARVAGAHSVRGDAPAPKIRREDLSSRPTTVSPANDFPYPLAGTWASGYRARRIRERIESQTSLERLNHRDLHQDAVSLRAVACLPGLCAALEQEADPVAHRLVGLLKDWNGDCRDDLVAPAVFNVFFVDWCKRVAAERFPEEASSFLAGGIEGLAAELLRADDAAGLLGPRRKAESIAKR